MDNKHNKTLEASGGDWKVIAPYTYGNNGWVIEAEVAHHRVILAEMVFVGLRRDVERGIAVQESNARLMAAAPALLEACQEALRMVCNCTGNWQIGVAEKLECAIERATNANFRIKGKP